MDCRGDGSTFVWVVVIFEVVVDRIPGVVEGGVFCDTSPEVGKCCVWFELEWVDQVAFANECKDDVGGGKFALRSPCYVFNSGARGLP